MLIGDLVTNNARRIPESTALVFEHVRSKVVACVVSRSGCTEADVMDLATKNLAGFKKPKNVLFFESLPSNEVGKIVKKDLPALVAERLGIAGAK
jgi:non-ribosomal peptide synthetase component E (peptide arylation enzyme)